MELSDSELDGVGSGVRAQATDLTGYDRSGVAATCGFEGLDERRQGEGRTLDGRVIASKRGSWASRTWTEEDRRSMSDLVGVSGSSRILAK
jgi:hypothetical protein